MAAPANRQEPAGHREHVHLAPRQNSEYFFFEGLGGYFMLCGCSSKRQWSSGSPSLQPYGPAPRVEEGQEGQAVTEQVTSTWNHRPGPEQRVAGGESATLHGRPRTAASATSPTCTGPSAGAAVTEARSTVFGGGEAPGSRPVTSPHSPGTSARGPDPGPRASLCARAILSASGANMASRHRGARTGAPTCR